MVTRTNSTARLLGVAASTLVLAAGTTALPSGPAHAADTITAADQPYFAYYHLDQARAKATPGRVSPSQSWTARSTPAHPSWREPISPISRRAR